MSPVTIAFIFLLLGALWYWCTSHRKNGHNLPPGPRGLPIIGNLHILGTFPHRTLEKLSQKYGPIMYLRLGCVPTIVVSSPQAAELFLKTHDTIFANRPKVQYSQYVAYGAKAVGFTAYGTYWRNVRKLCTLELLSTSKIDSFVGMRMEEVELLVKSIGEAAVNRQVVDLSGKMVNVIEDITYRMIFGRNKDERFDLKGVIQDAMHLAGVFNLSDYIPLLRGFDLQGLTRRMKATSKAFDKILETIISEREQDASNNHQRKYQDFVETMLSLMKNSSKTHDELSFTIDRTNIKAIVFDMIAATLDTSSSAIEWTLSELIRHPRVMKKLQQELESVVGVHKMVEETDLPKLEYLDVVIKEGLRLHPVGPLLIPHESMEDIVINGYHIPKKSRVLVNIWTIGRDPRAWSETANEFIPERFIGSNIDFRGHDLRFMPFGVGRRGCPGMYLGLINVRLVLAQLVHCFDWELPNGMLVNELDMTEKFGLTMPRAKPLLAIPTCRLHT
uniref:Cytochrome P450 n=1 Tax=Nothapodytes nimmoniana TaxID=159386 RepID=A0A7L7RB81_NOTNI|nr:cytochrome P450 [Nothapodytes nimmoniana]